MAWQTILVPAHPRTRRTADGTYYTHDGTGRLRVREHHLAELARQGGVRPPGTVSRAQAPFIPTPPGGPPAPVPASPAPVPPRAPAFVPPDFTAEATLSGAAVPEAAASEEPPVAPKRGKTQG